jgi:hypothetical protein
MNLRELVLRVTKISEKYNLDQNNHTSLLVKIIVLSLKYVDRRALFEHLYPSEYVDWELADLTLRTNNALGDTEPWLALLNLFEWPSLPDKETEQAKPVLAQIKSALKANNLDQPGWTVACRVLILQLIQGLQSMHAIELMTSRLLQKNTRESTMQLLASLYDQKHLPSAYFDTLSFIFSPSNVAINSGALSQTIAILSAQKEEHKLSMKMKNIQLVSLRPRLRDRLKTFLLTEQNKVKVDNKLGTWDSYTGFCHTHRFPNNLSDRVKRQIYFLASQTTWDWRLHVHKFIQHADLQEKIQQHPVTQPDTQILVGVIEGLSMDGRPPFPEMMQFKARCFSSFPVIYVQKMTLTQILRLYIAAYQAPGVWKEIWKSLIGMMSPQISRDCEKFVSEVQFASDWVAEALSGIPASIAPSPAAPDSIALSCASSASSEVSSSANPISEQSPPPEEEDPDST